MLRSLFLIFLFLLPAAAFDLPEPVQYLVSYRGAVRDHQVVSERFHVARSMVEVPDFIPGSTLTLSLEENERSLPVPALLRRHQDEITQALFRRGIMLTDRQESGRFSTTAKTVVTLPSTLVTVAVNEDLVIIGLPK